MRTFRSLRPLLAVVLLVGGCANAPSPVVTGRSTAPSKPANQGTPAFMTLHAATEPGDARPVPAPEPAPDPVATENVTRATFADEGADFDPELTPDSSTLVFASTQHRRTSDIYSKRVGSRVVTQLTADPANDSMPAVSPDGQWIAFASDRAGNWDIYAMPIEGGKAVRVTSDPADEVHPSWSPDGSRLAYSRLGEASGRWELWTASASNPDRATFLGLGLFPRWCPVAGTGRDGADQILFQQPRERGGRTFGVWTMDVTESSASNLTEIAAAVGTAYVNPAWSPDGRWIVFSEIPADQAQTGRTAATTRTTSGTLWLVGTDGEARVRLTGGRGLNLSPVWGSDHRLYFVSDRSGRENIWTMEMGPAVASAAAGVPLGTRNASAPGPETTVRPGTQAQPIESADNSALSTAGTGEPSDPR